MQNPSTKTSLFERLQVGVKRIMPSEGTGGILGKLAPQPKAETAPCVPAELVIAILGKSDAKSLLKCRTVSHRFRTIIDTSPELQYIIALYIAGCEEITHYTKSMAIWERLRLLHEYQSSWRAARLISHKLEAPSPGMPIWQFCQGNLAVTTSFTGIGTAPPTHANFITFYCLCLIPTGPTDALVRTWKIISPTEHFSLFVPYAERNLLATLSHINSRAIINLLSLSDGTPRGVIEFRLITEEPIVMKFEGNLLAVIVRWHYGSWQQQDFLILFIFDWTTGCQVASLSRRINHHRVFMNTSFEFISSSHFILGMSYAGSFYAVQLYSMEDMTIPMDAEAPAPRHVATFQLPVFQQQCLLNNTMTFGRTIQGTFARHRFKTPFHMSPSSTMLCISGISGRKRTDAGVEASLIILVHLSAFLDILSSKWKDELDSPEYFPWATWGPEYTRCFDALDPGISQLNASYGTRIIFNDLMLDFNQRYIGHESRRTSNRPTTIRQTALKSLRDALGHKSCIQSDKPAADPHQRPSPGRIVISPTIIPCGELFEHDIVTALPYYETRISWPDGVRPEAIYGSEVWITQSRDSISANRVYHALLVDLSHGNSSY